MTVIANFATLKQAHGPNLCIRVPILDDLTTDFAFNFQRVYDRVDVSLLLLADLFTRIFKVITVEADQFGLVRCVRREWIEIGGHLLLLLLPIGLA